MSLQSFHDEHVAKCVNYWFNAKNHCLSPHKLYKKHESKKTKQPHFKISDILQNPKAPPIHLHQKMKLFKLNFINYIC